MREEVQSEGEGEMSFAIMRFAQFFTLKNALAQMFFAEWTPCLQRLS